MFDYYTDAYYDRKKTIEIELADYLKLEFSGMVSEEVIENLIDGRLPRIDQKLSINISGVDVQNYADAVESAGGQNFDASAFGKADFEATFEFLPSKKQINIKRHVFFIFCCQNKIIM